MFSALLQKIQPYIPDHIPVYLVGGAVRDILLNRTNHDLDFAVDGRAIPLARKIADQLGVPFFPLDHDHDTARIVFTQPDGTRVMLDFAALRAPTLEEDLRDRDFTVNAIALNIQSPETFIDPLNGAQDLLDKQLRVCSPHAFTTDPIRTVRGVRQALALGFRLEKETLHLLRASVPALPETSIERRRDEAFRILGGPQPATAIRLLDMLGILPHIFPETTALKGVTQSPPHIYDVWEHTLRAITWLETLLGVLSGQDYDPDAVGGLAPGMAVMSLGRYRQQFHQHLLNEITPDRTGRALLMFAALYHDIAKPAAKTQDEDGRIRFFGHDKQGAQVIRTRAQALRLSNQEVARLGLIVENHMRPHLLGYDGALPTPRATYRFFRDTSEAGVDVCLFSLADVLGTYGPTLPQLEWAHVIDVNRHLLEAWYEKPVKAVRPPALITGHDLIQQFSLPPGPRLGKLLEAVREAQVEGTVSTHDQALALVQELLSNPEA